MISVLIADDHRLFADGLAEALAATPDLDVVGVATDGSEALAMIERDPPDVLLVDLEMPTMDGFETLTRLSGRIPTVVVSMHADPEHRARAAALGALGFLSKSAPLADLAAAVRAAHAGEQFTDDLTLREVLKEHRDVQLDPGASQLTPRERELLALLGQGVTATDELADRLFISRKTVKNHLASIFEKLGVSDRAQAAIEAIRLGLARRR